jgi:hypothetical protein
MPVLGRCSVDHEVTRTSEIRKAVGAIFCTNPVARRFQRHPFYNHVFFCFFVGAYLFLRNQVGPNQIIPIKLASKTSAEISSWILYAGKVFHIFFLHADAFAENIFMHRTLLCFNTHTFHREKSSPRRSFSRAELSQFGLGCFLRIWCGKSSSVRSSSVLPEGVRNKRIAIYFNVFVLPEQVRQGKKQITMLLGVGFTCRDASIKQCVEVWKLWVNVVSVR